MEVEWSDAAKFARSKFYEDVNDIDIYVEDEDAATGRLFAVLLSRVFPDTVRIDTVFGLGGRTEVVKRFQQDDRSGGRQRLYIVDGDFACVADGAAAHVIPDGIFRLSRYCIENYLVDADAFFEVAHDEDGERTIPKLRNDADWDGWITELGRRLVRLFSAYAAAECLGAGIPTVSRPLEEIARDAEGLVDEAAIEQVIEDLRTATNARFGEGVFEAKLTAIEERVQELDDAHLTLPSGKRHLLPLLIKRLKWLTKSRTANKSLVMRLARFADATRLQDATNYVRN